ncbi:hypothetical protein RT41_GL001898 [Lactococcus fujiensis JCM 16395]|uniref:Uncharacterized protein n=2 Tax=Lactococcus fujiensis TaxID=610251 RepID=A0A2A5RK35_9LACT|nr:hypothetical protein RT41_GL001898 [Lactococcus fujiensis JCM 16395]
MKVYQLMKKKTILLYSAIGLSILNVQMIGQAQSLTRSTVNEKTKPITSFGKNHKVGGLIQTFIIQSQATQSQSTSQNGSLGSSGLTAKKTVLGATNLPSLWNPLNPTSANYGKTTPVLNQEDLNICWDYAGVDAIDTSAMKQLGTTEDLLPAYYDYLSASNAFSNKSNPLAVMNTDGTSRKLGDGNTIDYVPEMSVIGYNPMLPNNSFSQDMTMAQDVPINNSLFNSLKLSNYHVNDTYILPGLTTNQFPTTNAAIMTRINQIKQLVYQYGSAQFGVQAEYTLDYSENPTTAVYSHLAANKDFTSYTPYSAKMNSDLATTYNNQTYINQDHEMEIVGYDDNYSANNFSKKPGMNGAFIVKNSWGTDWGNGGYFYLSYADIFLAASDIYADGVINNNGETIYSSTNTSPNAVGTYYDFGYAQGSTSNSNIFSNTYNSQSTSGSQIEILNSISTDIEEAGAKVKLLYKVGAVTNSTKLSDFQTLGTYTFTDPGYQTIPFNAITLPRNSQYSIAFEVTNLTNYQTFPIPYESVQTSSSGQYPVIQAKNSWMDIDNEWVNASVNQGTNLFIDGQTSMSNVDLSTYHPIYRLYNSRNREHLYTADLNEATTLPKLSRDWKYEGITWQAPQSSSLPIYRIYNPKSGEHLYTKDTNEVRVLVGSGWKNEGIAFYSAGNLAIYRLYNPNAGVGSHFMTSSLSEKNALVKSGWTDEGIAWFGM